MSKKSLGCLAKSFHSFNNEEIRYKPYEEYYSGGDIYLTPKFAPHKSTLIWLHGIGQTGKGFVTYFNRPDFIVPPSTKIVLPCASEKKLNCTWFNYCYTPNKKIFVNKLTALDSREYIYKFIEEEAKILNNRYENIYLGGFSQGCSMALWLALESKKLYGGFCGFSGFLMDFVEITEKPNNDMPILLYHGNEDSEIPLLYAIESYKRLYDFNLNVKIFKEKGIKHEISEKGQECMRYYFNNLMDNNEDYDSII